MKALTKLALVSVGGFILTLTVFVTFIHPALNQIVSLNSQASAQQTQAQTLIQQITAYKNSQSDLNAVGSQSNILGRIVGHDDLQVAISEVESAAAKTGVTEGMTIQETIIDPNSPQTPPTPVITDSPNVEEVPYIISASGSFSSLVEFLQYLEHLPNFTEISGLTLDASTQTDANTTSNSSGQILHSDTLTSNINAVFFIKNPTP